MRGSLPVALTIAGSDPSGGAGVQADLKTFHQFGIYGEAVITLLTVQNSVRVSRLEVMPDWLVSEQIAAVIEDIPPAAGKTGARAVLIKGGHLESGATDILFDGETYREFSGPRIATSHTHGTGCTYSAAITAGLAAHATLGEAVAKAKRFIHEAIRTNPGL